MKKIITYGTFDMLHHGHIRLLERAKALGDYLVVGVTSESYDKGRGKLNVNNSLAERMEAVRATGLADEIIVEEYEGQKIDDILKYSVDTFAIGSDWKAKFDYLKEFCEVVYLERTKGISSTAIRNHSKKIIQIGIIGSGRIAERFVPESKYVSGVNVLGVYNPRKASAEKFRKKHELQFASNDFKSFLAKVDAVYIASPHLTHASYIRQCLENGKHVLCEKPMVLRTEEATELFELAQSKELVLLEAIKTAFAPAFQHLINLVKSGAIGQVKDVDASFTKLVPLNSRELDPSAGGGSMNELGSYVLLPIIKLLGTEYRDVQFFSFKKDKVDHFTRGVLRYDSAVATFKAGLGVKTEGELIISGTKGYAYVPAPWWKTEYYELRYEDQNKTKKYFYAYEEDGIRYAIHEFASLIHNAAISSYKLSAHESMAIVELIGMFSSGDKVMQMH